MSKIHSKYGGSSTEGHGLNQICFLRFRHCLNLDIVVGVLVVFSYEVCVYQVDCLRFQYISRELGTSNALQYRMRKGILTTTACRQLRIRACHPQSKRYNFFTALYALKCVKFHLTYGCKSASFLVKMKLNRMNQIIRKIV